MVLYLLTKCLLSRTERKKGNTGNSKYVYKQCHKRNNHKQKPFNHWIYSFISNDLQNQVYIFHDVCLFFGFNWFICQSFHYFIELNNNKCCGGAAWMALKSMNAYIFSLISRDLLSQHHLKHNSNIHKTKKNCRIKKKEL